MENPPLMNQKYHNKKVGFRMVKMRVKLFKIDKNKSRPDGSFNIAEKNMIYHSSNYVDNHTTVSRTALTKPGLFYL